jgi:hypothetical protein
MGLLDDAIREHLDLKRRRGADPSEIEREEAEALGPVRREAPGDDRAPEAAPAPEPALDEPASAYDEFDDEPEAGTAADDLDFDLDRPRPSAPPTTHDDVWAEPEEESATPPHGDPLAHQPTREFSATELGEALGHQRAAAAPEPTPEAAAPAPPPAAPEAEHAPADDADDAGAADPDDELEETPDFLQETPEHDRLWFEQKPPKDFDF